MLASGEGGSPVLPVGSMDPVTSDPSVWVIWVASEASEVVGAFELVLFLAVVVDSDVACSSPFFVVASASFFVVFCSKGFLPLPASGSSSPP